MVHFWPIHLLGHETLYPDTRFDIRFDSSRSFLIPGGLCISPLATQPNSSPQSEISIYQTSFSRYLNNEKWEEGEAGAGGYLCIDHESQEEGDVTLESKCRTTKHIQELHFPLFKHTSCSSQHFRIIQYNFKERCFLIPVISPEILFH